MNKLPPSQKILLAAAVLVPIVYFCTQAAAAPYFPNYSIFTTSASALGSNLSSKPSILNNGALLTGALSFLGSIGLAQALPRIGVSKIPSYLLALCLLSAGAASFWAGLHPLPSPRHNPGAIGAGLFVAPFAAMWAAWQITTQRYMRIAFLVNAMAFVVLGVIMSGAIGVDLAAIGGLIQKLIAATSLASIAVIAGIAIFHFSQRSPGRRSAPG